jgi:uncharacterized protein YecA (UPF0149 family)
MKEDVRTMELTMRDIEEAKYSHLTQAQKDAVIEPVRTEPKIQNNEPCPCGSGKKFKKCCK